jgi:hypothetical protein
MVSSREIFLSTRIFALEQGELQALPHMLITSRGRGYI